MVVQLDVREERKKYRTSLFNGFMNRGKVSVRIIVCFYRFEYLVVCVCAMGWRCG